MGNDFCIMQLGPIFSNFAWWFAGLKTFNNFNFLHHILDMLSDFQHQGTGEKSGPLLVLLHALVFFIDWYLHKYCSVMSTFTQRNFLRHKI